MKACLPVCPQRVIIKPRKLSGNSIESLEKSRYGFLPEKKPANNLYNTCNTPAKNLQLTTCKLFWLVSLCNFIIVHSFGRIFVWTNMFFLRTHVNERNTNFLHKELNETEHGESQQIAIPLHYPVQKPFWTVDNIRSGRKSEQIDNVFCFHSNRLKKDYE